MRLGHILALVIVGVSFCKPGAAQPAPDTDEPVDTRRNGFHIYAVRGSFGYSSNPGLIGSIPASGTTGGSYDLWGAASVGYSYASPLGSFAASYSPSYSGTLRSPRSQTFNQELSIQFSRQLGKKTTWDLRGVGSQNTFEEYLFRPTPLSDIVTGPVTADKLVDTVTGASAPGLTGTAETVFYGARVLRYSAATGITFRPSTRVRFSFEGAAEQAQSRPSNRDLVGSALPRAESISAFFNFGYAITPRTEVGVDFSGGRTYSIFTRQQYFSSGVFLTRRLGVHWFASLRGGAGASNYLSRATFPTSYTYTMNASIGYQKRWQTWAATYSRYPGDRYGFGTRATDSFTGAWSWRPPQRDWGIQIFGTNQRSAGDAAGRLSVWQGGAGASRALGRRVSLGLEYAYLDSHAPTVHTGLRGHAVRLNVTWIPLLRDALGLRSEGGTQ